MDKSRKPPAILFGSPRDLPFVYPRELLQEIGQWVDWRIPLEETFALPLAGQVKQPLPSETVVPLSTRRR